MELFRRWRVEKPEKKDCGCSKRAKGLLKWMGYAYCGDNKVYTWKDFVIKEDGVEKRHSRVTCLAVLIRILFPTWKREVKSEDEDEHQDD